MTHQLKIEEQYLENLISGKKKSEVRRNDRDYQIGDVLDFTAHARNYFDGFRFKRCEFKIMHIHSGLGMQQGYVVLSVEQI